MTGLFMRKDNRRKRPGFGILKDEEENDRNQEEPGWKREAGIKAERRCWMK